MVEQLTAEQVRFLDGQRLAHLATVDEAGKPHIVPICYALMDGALYTPIDEKPKRGDPTTLRRVRNIQANPEVCILVDTYDEDWTRLAWVQIRGRAALVTDAMDRSRGLAALRDRYPQYRAMDLESRPLIRVTPARVVQWKSRAESL